MKSFEAFMDVTDVPAGADVADAHARLSAALGGEIGVEEFGEPEGEIMRPAPSFWTPFRVRVVGAVAAVLFVAVGLTAFTPDSTVISEGEPVLRGIGAPNAPFLVEMSRMENGEFRLSWPSVAEATGYRVVVYGEDLEVLAGFDAGTDLAFEFEAPDGAVFCWLIVYRDGDEIGKSEPTYLDD
jgi:hypothetical protein